VTFFLSAQCFVIELRNWTLGIFGTLR